MKKYNKFYSNTEDRLVIFKLNLIRLISHEIAHVALRHALNDFKISTPTLNESNENEMLKTIDEAGCLAEKRLFKGSIDWVELANKGFNLSY